MILMLMKNVLRRLFPRHLVDLVFATSCVPVPFERTMNQNSMLKKLHKSGNRVLVFSQMTALLDILQVGRSADRCVLLRVYPPRYLRQRRLPRLANEESQPRNARGVPRVNVPVMYLRCCFRCRLTTNKYPTCTEFILEVEVQEVGLAQYSFRSFLPQLHC